MAYVLAPPVDGGAKRYAPLASLVAGTVLGGLIPGALLALAWLALEPFDVARTSVVVGMAALAAAAVVWEPLRDWFPERPCQVRSALMHGPVLRTALRWGAELGTGVYTYVVTPAIYAVLAVSLAQSNALFALALPPLYGLSRGLAIAWFAIRYGRAGGESHDRLPGVGLERALRVPLVVAVGMAVAAAVA